MTFGNRSRLRRLGTSLMPMVLLATLAVLSPAGSFAHHDPPHPDPERLDLSSVAAIRDYLTDSGYDGAGALVLEGANNYAGANCPGAGWTCGNPAVGQAVIQRTSGSGENRFEGTRASCVVVQVATGGANTASCTQRTTANAEVDAFLTQENVNAANTATISQNGTVRSGIEQAVAQRGRIHQEIEAGGTGSNTTNNSQRINQAHDSVGPVHQVQTSSQQTIILQIAATADNSVASTQDLRQRQNASGPGVLQEQNPDDERQYVDLNVDQHGDDGTDNTLTFSQSTNQQQVVNPASGVVEQVQGCLPCGIEAHVHQKTTAGGSNLANENQHERQHQVANGAGTLEQRQIGPISPPPPDGVYVPSTVNGVRCCSDQEGSTDSTMNITQSSSQSSDGGEDASQDNFVLGSCHSAGICNVFQTVSNNDGTTTNSCTGSDCRIAILCLDAPGCDSADTEAPETTMTSTPPAESASSSATFEFTSNETGGFLCQLDGGATQECSSPHTYTGLADGEHHIHVYAVDLAGNIDETPAEFTWTVDTLPPPPDTFIDSGPPELTSSRTATFTYHAVPAGTDFACSLDGTAFADCDDGSVTYSGLADGTHTFAVRAVGPGGPDESAATDSWTVDGTGPTSAFTTSDLALVCGNPPCPPLPLPLPNQVTGTAGDPLSGIDKVLVTFNPWVPLGATTVEATLTCNEAATSCTWTAEVPGIPPGPVDVWHRAFDEAGNSSDQVTIRILVV